MVPVLRQVMAKGQAMKTTNKALLTTLGVAIAIAVATLTAEAQRRVPAHVTVPAGTILDVRLTQTIDADYATPGATYHAILDYPVVMHGVTVIPSGARVLLEAVYVKQSGTFKGSDRITLTARSVSFGGRRYGITTTDVASKSKGQGKKTAKKVGIGAGIGAAVGGLFGGGAGAAIGAAAGGTTGAIVQGQSGGAHLFIPAETRMQFQLTNALNVLR